MSLSLAVLSMALFWGSPARGQKLPEVELKEERGTTEMSPTVPSDTEVLGAEVSASSSRPAGVTLEKPIDPDQYVCGPGDVFEVNFWGKQNFRLAITADLEGRVFISKVGFVKVVGESLTHVRSLVGRKIKRSYPGLTFELTLMRPRQFLVHVVDYVRQPGPYAASSLDRVSTVLARAGGITGSQRRVEIKRTDGSRLLADLLLYARTGDTSYNPYVLDGDVIHVPPASTVVSISGPVVRPGTYELIGARDLNELLELAGGFTSQVTRRLPIRLIRRNKEEEDAYVDLPFEGLEPKNVALKDDDHLVVRSVAEFQRTILIVGAVTGADPLDRATTTKRLPFIEGDTVRSLLDRAGGIQAPGDLRNAYISRPRNGADPELIGVDLEALMVRRDFTADKAVHMGDVLVIPRMRMGILVEGAVARSGLYDYNPRFGVPEYVAHAGGRTRTARGMGSVKLIDPKGKTAGYRRGLPVRPGDTIIVPERDFTRAEVVQLIMAGAGLVLSGIAVTIAATR